MGMTDPYQKLYESIAKVLNKLSEMILWIAVRSLSAKEYSEFIDKFSEKPDKSEIPDFIKQKGR